MTLQSQLAKAAFPRASGYDAQWLMENVMGPHPLWLAEWLTQAIELRPGMRVLDLGCGRAVTSIFLAREFGVEVIASDLWIKAAENVERAAAAGVLNLVTPVHAEAHALPFEPGEFDAIVSFDAYHYFGTDDLYLGYITRFLRPGGIIGVVVPGVREEISEVPQHLRPFWDWEFCSFHTAQWWRRHWEKTGLVKTVSADWQIDGWKLWLQWNELCHEHGPLLWQEIAGKEAAMLRADAGRTFGFARVVGSKA